MRDPAISFLAAGFPAAAEAGESLRRRYGQRPPDEADVIVALGGDGFMIETLHRFMRRAVPIYGINRGTVGFLMNRYPDGELPDDLPARIEAAVSSTLRPLRMRATAEDGRTAEALAINEVSLLRETRLAAHLRVSVDGRVRLDRLMCDGAIMSTPAGSTAYNLSAHGPILPLRSRLLALTPICAFRPRRWHGALLPESAAVVLDVLDADRRPVSATADYTEVRGVTRVSIEQDGDTSLALLFDPEHNLEERIIAEQFQTLP